MVGIDLDRALEEVVHVADEALILRPHRQREHVGCRRASPKGGHPFLVTMNRGLPGDDLLDLRPRDADVPEPGLDKYPIGFFVGDADEGSSIGQSDLIGQGDAGQADAQKGGRKVLHGCSHLIPFYLRREGAEVTGPAAGA